MTYWIRLWNGGGNAQVFTIEHVYDGIFNLFLAAATWAKVSFEGHFNIFVKMILHVSTSAFAQSVSKSRKIWKLFKTKAQSRCVSSSCVIRDESCSQGISNYNSRTRKCEGFFLLRCPNSKNKSHLTKLYSSLFPRSTSSSLWSIDSDLWMSDSRSATLWPQFK